MNKCFPPGNLQPDWLPPSMPPKKTRNPKKTKEDKRSAPAPAPSIEEQIRLYVLNSGHSVKIDIKLLVLDNYRDISRDGVDMLKKCLDQLYLPGLNMIVKDMADGTGRYLVVDGSHRVVAWMELIREGKKPPATEVECMVYGPATPPHILNLLASAANHASTITVAETYIDKMCWVRYLCCFFL